MANLFIFFLIVCKETNKYLCVKGFFPNLAGENPYFMYNQSENGCHVIFIIVCHHLVFAFVNAL